jgi:hypothetical protein
VTAADHLAHRRARHFERLGDRAAAVALFMQLEDRRSCLFI